MAGRKPKAKSTVQVENYDHPTADNLTRPEAGTQARYPLKEKPKTYRYDSSLSPSLEWDGQNSAREEAEALIRQVLDAASLEVDSGELYDAGFFTSSAKFSTPPRWKRPRPQGKNCGG
jgi:hypothetical protein